MIPLLKRREYIREPLFVEELPFRWVSRRGWNISGTKDTFLRAKKKSPPSIYRNSSGQLADQFYIPLNTAVDAMPVQFIRPPLLYPEYLNIRDNISPARLASCFTRRARHSSQRKYRIRCTTHFSPFLPPVPAILLFLSSRFFSSRRPLVSRRLAVSILPTLDQERAKEGSRESRRPYPFSPWDFSSPLRGEQEKKATRERSRKKKRDETLVVLREKETTRR